MSLLFCDVSAELRAKERKPIPERLVVLTFDDGNRSDLTFVAPLLKQYGFRATFFITEGLDYASDKESFLNWQEVRRLYEEGFEIGNHTGTHPNVIQLSRQRIHAELEQIERRCREYDIAHPRTFCYPSYHTSPAAVEVLAERGYLFARRGGRPEYPYSDRGDRGPAYDPRVDHPLLVPTTGAAGPNWTFDDFLWAIQQARDGKIAVLTFHGVPSLLHPWVSTPPELFAKYMEYLHEHDYTVIALGDLVEYVDPAPKPADPYAPIHRRLGVRPVQLRCEYAVNPLGLDVSRPRFSWQLESTRRQQKQAAYQILVASSQEKLAANRGDLWDSGKVANSRSVNVEYQGQPLSSGQMCFWKVRCWNEPGYDGEFSEAPYLDPVTYKALRQSLPGDYSQVATFEMGLLEQDDWQGQWIAAEQTVSAPLLRRRFELEEKVGRARVYVSGIGWYELYLNGRKVSDHVLDPASSYYSNDQPFDLNTRVLYVTHDVTDYLQQGENVIGVWLGHGWYSCDGEPVGRRQPYGDRPQVRLQLQAESVTGKVTRVVTDDTWKTAVSPITENDMCQGEVYDARLEKPQWHTAGTDDSDWRPALVVDALQGELVAQKLPAVKVIQTLEPIALLEPQAGVFIYDFGQHITGWARLKVQGPVGAQVQLRYAGRLHDDNTLDRTNNTSVVCAEQIDRYILQGAGVETWEPRFTHHGFRYVEVTGFPGRPRAESLQARVVHGDVETTGGFVCSNPLFNRIHQNIYWTLRGSFQGILQDAADRCERDAWLGDPGFIVDDYLYNFDTATYFAKWLDDIRDSQKANGDLPVISPLHWRFEYQPWYCWKSTYPIFVWAVHRAYADERILAEHYEGLKKLVTFLGTRAENDIIPDGLGDHMEPDRASGKSSFQPQRTPASFTSTAYYYHDTWILAQAARILGKSQDYADYSALAEAIRNAMQKEFFQPDSNHFATGSQTANALALHLQLVRPEDEPAVLANLIDNVLHTNDGHLATGIIGTNALVEVLGRFDRSDILFQIASQTSYPSWGYSLAQGATTLWESFEVDHHSLNMKMFASIDKFFYRHIAGIQMAAPGYQEIVIKPTPVGDLTFARTWHNTIRGPIAVDWKRTDQSFDLLVTLPVNSAAQVYVPCLGLQDVTVTESHRFIWKDGTFIKRIAGVRSGRLADDAIIFTVGSGDYRFRLQGR